MSPYTPAPIVEIAFGYGPFHATPVWTDVSSYVKSATLSHGRSSELDNFTAGTMTIVLKNDTRLFDPLYSAGTYYGQLLPNVPVRVRALKSAVYYSVWQGFADGFEVTPGTITSECVVSCTDAFGILATKRLPDSVYATTILADTPQGFWRLGADSGDAMTDSSGNSYDGVWGSNALRGQDSVIPYSGNGSAKPSVANTVVGVIDNAATVLSNMLVWSVEFWFQSDDTTGGNGSNRFIDGDTVGSNRGFRIIGFGGTASVYGGELYVRAFNDANVAYYNVNVFDALPHHIVVTYNGSVSDALLVVYVDGVAIPAREFQSDVTTAGTSGRFVIGPRFGGTDILSGRIDEVAIYSTVLTAAQVRTHHSAGVAPWDGDTTGGRITRVLDLIGWPSALRSIDAGEFLVGPANIDGRNALEYLQSIAQSEQGRLFVDASGKITFHQRDRFLTQSTETTVQYTFSDAATGITVDPSLRFTLDKSFLYNEAQVTRDGGETQSASNSTSITSYGPRTRSLSGLVLRDDRNARSIAEYIVYRYKTPQVRASAWTVVPELKVADWASILGLEIGHRIKLAITPQGVGSATTTELHIESIAHTITDDDWRITFTGSPTDNAAYLLWGSGLWGTGVWR